MVMHLTRLLRGDARITLAALFFGLGMQLTAMGGDLDLRLWPGNFASTGLTCGVLLGTIAGLLIPVQLARGNVLQWIRRTELLGAGHSNDPALATLARELLAASATLLAAAVGVTLAGAPYITAAIEALPHRMLLLPAEWIATVFLGMAAIAVPIGLFAGAALAVAFYLLLAKNPPRPGTPAIQHILPNVAVWVVSASLVGMIVASLALAERFSHSQLVLSGCVAQLLAALWTTYRRVCRKRGKGVMDTPAGKRPKMPVSEQNTWHGDEPEHVNPGGLLPATTLVTAGLIIAVWASAWPMGRHQWRILNATLAGLQLGDYLCAAVLLGAMTGLLFPPAPARAPQNLKTMVGQRLLPAGMLNALAVALVAYGVSATGGWRVIVLLAAITTTALAGYLAGRSLLAAIRCVARTHFSRTASLSQSAGLIVFGVLAALAATRLFAVPKLGVTLTLASVNLLAVAVGGLAIIYGHDFRWSAAGTATPAPRFGALLHISPVYVAVAVIVLMISWANNALRESDGFHFRIRSSQQKRHAYAQPTQSGQSAIPADRKESRHIERLVVVRDLPAIVARIVRASGSPQSVLLLHPRPIDQRALTELLPDIVCTQIQANASARMIDLRIGLRQYDLVIFTAANEQHETPPPPIIHPAETFHAARWVMLLARSAQPATTVDYAGITWVAAIEDRLWTAYQPSSRDKIGRHTTSYK